MIDKVKDKLFKGKVSEGKELLEYTEFIKIDDVKGEKASIVETLEKVGEVSDEDANKVDKIDGIVNYCDNTETVEHVLPVEGVTQAERLIPGTPGVVSGGDSTKLGKNIMESMGLKRSTKWTGHQAQHIIPAEMADNPILQKIGMDLDDATNGILLRTPDAELSAM